MNTKTAEIDARPDNRPKYKASKKVCVFFYGATYQKSESTVFMRPEKGVPSAVVVTVRR